MNVDFEPRYAGDVDSAAHREICPATASLEGTDAKLGPAAHVHRRAPRNGHAVDRRPHRRAGQGDDAVGPEAQRRPDECDLETGRARVVSDDAVRDGKGVVVHRPGRGNADGPEPHAPGAVLHRRLRSAVDDVDRRRPVLELREELGRRLAGYERRRDRDLAQVLDVRLHTRDPRGGERRPERRHRGFARVSADDDLGEERVVERTDLGARFDPSVDSHAGRERRLGDQFQCSAGSSSPGPRRRRGPRSPPPSATPAGVPVPTRPRAPSTRRDRRR